MSWTICVSGLSGVEPFPARRTAQLLKIINFNTNLSEKRRFQNQAAAGRWLLTEHCIEDFLFVAAPAPPDAKCEWFIHRDTLGTSAGQVVVKAMTVTECMRLCQDVACQAVSFDTAINSCILHSQHTHDIALSTPADAVTYDYYCFEGESSRDASTHDTQVAAAARDQQQHSNSKPLSSAP